MTIALTKEQRAELDALQLAYQSAAQALSDALVAIHSDWQSEYDDHSEKWQESNAGALTMDRMDTLSDAIDTLEAHTDALLDLDQLSSPL